MLKLLFATTNIGKLNEAQALADSFGMKIVRPTDVSSVVPEVDETGSTYHENARLKADAFYSWSNNHSVFADDSGVEVMALNGAPGLYSARYAGIECQPAENRAKLLKAMIGAASRDALLRCVLCLKLSDADIQFFEGVLPGHIATAEKGVAGFGYDSLFIPDGYDGLSLAELKGRNIKVKTHRYLALEALCKGIRK